MEENNIHVKPWKQEYTPARGTERIAYLKLFKIKEKLHTSSNSLHLSLLYLKTAFPSTVKRLQ